MRIWRISNYADLRGSGGIRAGGRWHSRGNPIVYCAENPATALLEVLVHLEIHDPDDLPDSYQLLSIDLPDAVARQELDRASLSDDWRARSELTRSLGDAWLKSMDSAILFVPNAIIPYTANILLNPRHPDSALLRISAADRYPFDERLFKKSEPKDPSP
jgi:RES domain-containing protein